MVDYTAGWKNHGIYRAYCVGLFYPNQNCDFNTFALGILKKKDDIRYEMLKSFTLLTSFNFDAPNSELCSWERKGRFVNEQFDTTLSLSLGMWTFNRLQKPVTS